MRDLIEFSFGVLDRAGVVFGASHLELIRCRSDNQVKLIELNARLAGDFPRACGFYEFNYNLNCPAPAPASSSAAAAVDGSSADGTAVSDHSAFLREFGVNQFSLLALAAAAPHEFLAFARLQQASSWRAPVHEDTSPAQDADAPSAVERQRRTRGPILYLKNPHLSVCAVFLVSPCDGKFNGKGLAEVCSLKSFAGLRRALGHFPVPPFLHPLRLILKAYERAEEQWEVGQKQLGERGEDEESPDAEAADEDAHVVEFPSCLGSTKKTTSLRSCPGVVLLAASTEQVQKDKIRIRTLEKHVVTPGENQPASSAEPTSSAEPVTRSAEPASSALYVKIEES